MSALGSDTPVIREDSRRGRAKRRAQLEVGTTAEAVDGNISIVDMSQDPIPGPAAVGPNLTLNRGSTYLGKLALGDDLVMPLFDASSPLTWLGVYSIAESLNNIQRTPFLLGFMLPCTWHVDPASNKTTFISFATLQDAANSTACSASMSMDYTLSFAPFNGGDVNGSVAQPSGVMRRMSCGSAVDRSVNATGTLHADTCNNISRQVAEFTGGVRNDIGNSTALFVFDAVEAGLPTFCPITYASVSVELHAQGLPGPVQATLVDNWLLSQVRSVAGPNTPSYLRDLYAAPLLNTGAAKGLLVAVSDFPGSAYDYSPVDLHTANEIFGVPNASVASLINPNSPYFEPNNPSNLYGPNAAAGEGESTLDIQMLTQFAAGSGISYGFAASNASSVLEAATVYQIIAATFGLEPFPDIISWSWTDQQIMTNSYLKAIEATLAKYAAMGITVLVSSGDQGSSGAGAPTDCSMAQLTPAPPATSPYVTSVGAVMQSHTHLPSHASAAPELVVCMAGAGGVTTSGGGFADQSEAPRSAFSWQSQRVQKYLAAYENFSSPYWPSQLDLMTAGSAYCDEGGKCTYGRGYPDIALIGNVVPILLSGMPERASGTSVTTPTMAGLVAQLNAAIRATPGLEKRKIGFMNPFLYWAATHFPSAFTDITIGGNYYPTEYSSLACPGGYPAAPGWDATTGLGMPNMTALTKAAIKYIKLQQQQQGRHKL